MHPKLEKWHAEHRNFSRLLGLVDAWTEQFRAGEDVDYELLRDVMYYMTHYPDRFHHPFEDVVFEEIARRDDALRVPVEELASQHRQIAERGQALVDDLEAILGDAVLSRAALVSDAAAYSELMRRHMKVEEEVIMPVIAARFSDADWDAMRERVEEAADPLFGDAVEQRYAGIRRVIARDVGCDC